MDNYIFITADGHPLPIADKLKDEGKNVIVGLIENPPSKETPESDEKRHELYEGILDIHPAESVMDQMEEIKNKDDYFVMFDFGDLWEWSERALKMGFTKGVFPTEEGFELESDRVKAKEFAKNNYPGLVVADAPEFKTVEEAKKFLDENSEKIYVLKSEGSDAETIVPLTTDPELARRQILGALASEKGEYEKSSFTLEEKIAKPIEISPVMVFWDGKPIFSLVELENKGYGAGNIGRLTGGCQNLSIQTPLDCKLNDLAFPKAAYELAGKQPGIGIYDAGLLFDGNQFFFTEFCSQRWGWDGIFSELAMCRKGRKENFVSRHFDYISEGKNPLQQKFGTAVRLFQTQPASDCGGLYKDGYTMDWMDEVSEDLFFYTIRQEQDGEEKRFVTVGYRKDVGVAVGSSDFMEASVNEAYRAAKGFAMTGIYYRPKFDFLSKQYFTSIMNRYSWLTNSGLI